jgi:hypothetical protein
MCFMSEPVSAPLRASATSANTQSEQRPPAQAQD